MPLDAKTRWEYVRAGRVRILGSCWEHFCWLARFPLVYTTARFCSLARKAGGYRARSSKPT